MQNKTLVGGWELLGYLDGSEGKPSATSLRRVSTCEGLGVTNDATESVAYFDRKRD